MQQAADNDPCDGDRPSDGRPHGEQSDKEPDRLTDHSFNLIARHQAGDSTALKVLIERYYPRIRRIVRIRSAKRLHASASLDDVVQGVIMRILKGVDHYECRSGSQFIHWVSRLVTNELCDEGRRAQRRPELKDKLSDILARESRGVVTRIADAEEQAMVDSCVRELPEDQREVLLLRDYEGAPWEEVLEQIDRPTIGACQQLHQRARAKLKELTRTRCERPD